MSLRSDEQRSEGLTCAKAKVSFTRFIEIFVEKALRPEALGLFVLGGVVGYCPMVPCHGCAGWDAIAFVLVIGG